MGREMIYVTAALACITVWALSWWAVCWMYRGWRYQECSWEIRLARWLRYKLPFKLYGIGAAIWHREWIVYNIYDALGAHAASHYWTTEEALKIIERKIHEEK